MKQWNKHVFGDVDLKVNVALANLEEILRKIAVDGFSDEVQVEENLVQLELQKALDYQEAFWKEKSILDWHSHGDRNTSFFHRVTKIRQASKVMTVLKNGEEIIDDPKHWPNMLSITTLIFMLPIMIASLMI